MKSTFALTLTLLAACITGTPIQAPRTLPAITIQFANDYTGRNADVSVTADGTPKAVAALFAGTSIDVGGGEIVATSAQLVAFVQGTECVVTDSAGNVVASLTTDRTYADLDGDANAAVPTVVSGDFITCEV